MLLDRIDDKTFESLRESAGSQPVFEPNLYRLFFQYNTAAGAMIYLAVRKNPVHDAVPLGYYFSIGADLAVHPGSNFPWFPLLEYLRAYEQHLSVEQQKELYGEIYFTLGAIAGLSKNEMAERESARRAFLSFLNRMQEKGLMIEKNINQQALTLRFELSEPPMKNKPLLFRMKLGQRDGKIYYVQNAKVFCQALKIGGEMAVRPRISVHLAPDAFEDVWRPLMACFSDYVRPSTASGASAYFQVPQNRIPAFISLLPKGDRVEALLSAEGPWIIREERTPASVSLDSAGTLSMYPKRDTGKSKIYAISGKQMAVLDPAHRTAVLYQFEDPVSAELYNYFSERTSREVGYVSDLLIQRILPVSTGILRKSEENVFAIAVHISLEGEALLFQTEYQLDGEKKDPSCFEGKPFEQALIHSCSATLQALHGTENGLVDDPEDVLFFLKSDLEPLRQVATVYVDERLKNLKIRHAPTVQIRASQSRGWLNLSFHSSEYSREELAEIYAAYRRKKSFFLLKDSIILLEPEKMAPVGDIIHEAGAEKDLSDVRLPFYHVMWLEGYREAGIDVSADANVEKALRAVIEYKKASIRLSPDLKDVLRPYQTDGVRWMKTLYQYGFSGILADDMGLGKTLEVLAFLSVIDCDKPVLVVCPKSLVYNWRNEIRKWLGDVPIAIITGTKSARLKIIESIPETGRLFCVAGYDSLRLDVDAYGEKSFLLTVVDEAQNIKNASTQKAKAIRKINSDMRLALTGTPVENSLTDLWSICDYLMPGYLGTEADFRKRYESDSNPSGARAILARKMAPFLLRRRKEDVLDALPEKEVVEVTVSMTDRQRGIYEAYLHKAREQAMTQKGVSVFSALTQLRQICVDPSVFLEDYDEMSAKFSVALDQVIASIEGGHQVLVFSSFTRVLEHFRYYLEEKDIRSYYINGDTPSSMRVEMADKFNREGRIKVMLVSIKAGGTGLNLVGADIVIHLDPWWNFAVEEQATDRAHRIGQTRPVTVYKLIAHDSIEEKVVALQEEKRQTSGDVIQTSLNGIDSLTAEDIRLILQ